MTQSRMRQKVTLSAVDEMDGERAGSPAGVSSDSAYPRHARLEPPAYGFKPVETRALRSFSSGPLPKVTTVVAPPGFGKTVLMTQLHALYRARGLRCVWVGLEDRSIDLPALLAAVEAAFNLDLSGATAPIIVNPRSGLPARIGRILGALSSASCNTVLFLDNLNSCTDPDLALFIDALVFDSARCAHIVASSTRLVAFDTGRARLEMKERRLTPMDLCFDLDDTQAILADAGLDDVSRETVSTIVGRTEGWPAAVRLAQLVLGGAGGVDKTIDSFSGADSDFAALLSRRLMSTFDPDLVQFLFDISILRTFSADLAEAATENPRAADWIRYLLERHVLIIPLDRERTWFRFHTLLREFLLAETQAQNLARRRLVASRAARWQFANGDLTQALDLAIVADDASLMVLLLDCLARPMVRDRGELEGFIDLVRRVCAAGVTPGGDALFWFAWAQAFSRDYSGARGTLARLAQQTREAVGEQEQHPLWVRLRIAEIVVSFHLDDMDVVRTRAPAWLAAADDSYDAFDTAAVAAALSISSVAQFDFPRAREALRDVHGAIIRSDSDYGRAWAALVAAIIDLAQGDPIAADIHLRAVEADVRRNLGADAGIVSVMALLESRAAADRGRTDEALRLVRDWLPKGVSNGVLEIIWLAMDVATDALFTPEEPFDYGTLMSLARRFGPRLAFLLETAVIRRQLRIGAFHLARERCEKLGLLDRDGEPVSTLPRLRPSELSAARMTLIEYSVAAGQWRTANALIAVELQGAVEERRRREQVELRLFQAAIALRSGNSAAAHVSLARAVMLTARQSLMRPFLQQEKLVREIISSTPIKRLGLVQEADVAFFQALCCAFGVAPPAPAGAGEATATFAYGTATPRELDLLRMLDSGLDNAQIAAHLSLSLPTVKWHLSNIYSKLGVKNRSAALVRARQLRLLG